MLARWIKASVVAVAALALPDLATAAGPSSTFAAMSGSWSGSGQMRLEGGRTEKLRCRANYTDRNGGTGLGIALRCASASSKVDLRASLKATGSRIGGNWEEREFNAGGSASGSANGNHIQLEIEGGGLTGSMSVTTNGGRQSVLITMRNVALKGLQIALARD